MRGGAQKIIQIGRNTKQLDRALSFYCDLLGFAVDSITASPPPWTRLPGMKYLPSRCAHLSLGDQRLEITEFPDSAEYPLPATSCDSVFQHCAIVVSDIYAVWEKLVSTGTTPITRNGPQTLPPSAGSVTAWKFRDPDGHPLELLQFPSAPANGYWQTKKDQCKKTLGIDHTAITVSDPIRSISFYEHLGLRLSAKGLNTGPEQQNLDDLPDPIVEVIAMEAQDSVPHLELLGYHDSHKLVSVSLDSTAVAADRVEWQVDHLGFLLEQGEFRVAIRSCSIIDEVLVAFLQDPDGHWLLLMDKGKLSRYML